MSIQLFPHNQIAYNSALEMLDIWTGMDLHKRAKCGIICISGIEKGLDWLKKHKIAKCQPYALNYPA